MITANAPTSLLLDTLARDYWGVLSGKENRGIRNILLALNTMAKTSRRRGRWDTTGTIYAPAWQIGKTAAYGERWTRELLGRLEELGLISWVRGMIVEGRPTTSIIRISKTLLVKLIMWARKAKSKDEEAHRLEFMARMAKMKRYRVPSRGRHGVKTKKLNARFGCSVHAELSSSPFLLKKDTTRASTPEGGCSATDTALSDNELEEVKKIFHAITTPNPDRGRGDDDMRLPDRPDYDPSKLPDKCPHEVQKDPSTCLPCRESATNPHQLYMWKKRVRALTGYVEEEMSVEQIIEEKISTLATEKAIAEGYTMAAMVRRSMEIAAQLRERYKRNESPAFLWE